MDRKKGIDNAKKFYIVEFLELPYRTIEKYVIVPSSWILKRKSTDRRVNVAYPRENSKKTKNRSKRNERPKGDWKKYLAIIRYENNDYDAANLWIVLNFSESTNNGIIEKENGDSTNNADRNIVMKHHTVPSRNELLNTETRGNQLVTTKEKKTHSSCHNAKLNGKPPVKVLLVGNDRNARIESPQPSSSSSSAMIHEQLEIARETPSADEVSIRLSNLFEGPGTENLPLTHRNHLSRGQEMVRQYTMEHGIDGRDFSQSNARNTTAVTSTSSNHSHQSVESQNEELVSILSEGIIHNDCGHQEPVPKRSIERNGNDQSTHIMTPVTQNSFHLMNQQSPIPQNVPKSSPLKINGKHVHQELRGGERLDRPTEVNKIGQRAYPQDVTKNTPSAVSISTDSEHRPRTLCQCSQEQHPPAYKENSPQNSDTHRIGTTSPLKLKFVFNDKPHQIIKENALFAMQHLSNAANQLNQIIKHSHNQWQPAYEVPLQQDFPVNKTFFLASTEVGNNNQRVPSQSFTKNTSYTEQNIPSAVQYPLNSVAHTCCLSECSQGKRFSSFIPSNHFQGPRIYDPLISGSTGGNCSKQMVDLLIDMNSTGQSRHVKTTTEERSMANQNPSHVLNVSASNEAKLDQISTDDLRFLLSKIDSNLSTTLEAFKDIVHNTITEQNKTFVKSTPSGSGINETLTSSSRNVTKTLNKQRMRENVANNDYDVDNDESHEPSKKKSHQKYSLVLPPKDYSKKLKWTLKHQKASPGVVQVLPRSSVYIDAKKFTHCKNTARDYAKLARMLLPEIFSQDALRVCTLSEGKTTTYSASDVRPRLDKHAKNVLLTFVKEYGSQNGWTVYNEASVLKSLSNKISEIRSKASLSRCLPDY